MHSRLHPVGVLTGVHKKELQREKNSMRMPPLAAFFMAQSGIRRGWPHRRWGIFLSRIRITEGAIEKVTDHKVPHISAWLGKIHRRFF